MKLLAIYAVPLLFLNFTLQAQNTDSLFLNASIIKLKHAKDYTIKVAELMPEGKYSFKPTPDEMTFGEQLLHLSGNMAWLSSSYLAKTESPALKIDTPCLKKACIISNLAKTYDYTINLLQKFDPAHLADTVSFFAGTINKLQVLNLLNDHQTHHRAQLLVYLRLNKIKPPEYIGW